MANDRVFAISFAGVYPHWVGTGSGSDWVLGRWVEASSSDVSPRGDDSVAVDLDARCGVRTQSLPLPVLTCDRCLTYVERH